MHTPNAIRGRSESEGSFSLESNCRAFEELEDVGGLLGQGAPQVGQEPSFEGVTMPATISSNKGHKVGLQDARYCQCEGSRIQS